jgi:hypothetical protein
VQLCECVGGCCADALCGAAEQSGAASARRTVHDRGANRIRSRTATHTQHTQRAHLNPHPAGAMAHAAAATMPAAWSRQLPHPPSHTQTQTAASASSAAAVSSSSAAAASSAVAAPRRAEDVDPTKPLRTHTGCNAANSQTTG